MPDRVLVGFRAINDLAKHTSWLHEPAQWFADYGVVLFGVLLLVGLLRNRSVSLTAVGRSLLAGAGVLVAVAVNQPIVHAVGEPRPYQHWHDVLVLVHRSTDASFPSDHSVMAGAVAAGLLLSHRRSGLVAVPLALLMAADRVYVGAHYPADVVAGLALGAAVAVATQALSPSATWFLERLSHGPVRPWVLAASQQPVPRVRPRS